MIIKKYTEKDQYIDSRFWILTQSFIRGGLTSDIEIVEKEVTVDYAAIYSFYSLLI